MVELSIPDMESIAREAAQALAGADATVTVQVDGDEDSLEEPACFFSFVVQEGPSFPYSPALFRIRLTQQLRDRLIAKGDMRFPFIKRLSLRGAEQQANA